MAIQENDIQEFDINSLPELDLRVSWPRGVYDVEGVSLKQYVNDDNGKTSIGLNVKLDKIVEFLPATLTAEQLPTVGSETRFAWGIDNENGLKFFRHDITPLGKLTGGNLSSSAIAAAVVGAKLRIVSNVRVSTLTPEQRAAGEEARLFQGIKNIIVL